MIVQDRAGAYASTWVAPQDMFFLLSLDFSRDRIFVFPEVCYEDNTFKGTMADLVITIIISHILDNL